MIPAPAGTHAIYERAEAQDADDPYIHLRVVAWDPDGSPLVADSRGELRPAAKLGQLVGVQVPTHDIVAVHPAAGMVETGHGTCEVIAWLVTAAGDTYPLVNVDGMVLTYLRDDWRPTDS